MTSSREPASDSTGTSVRRSSIWYEDGSVVLQAQAVQFRVHKSILSAHSRFFSDMFAIPQPVGEELVEGCPVVNMWDAPQDVEHVLKAIYDIRYFRDQELQTVDTIGALLRLGKKYDFHRLRQEALSRLKKALPWTLEEFDRTSACQWVGIGTYPRIVSDLVSLAWETGVHSIFPYLLFVICDTHPLEEMTSGTGESPHLDPASVIKCVNGYSKLIQAQYNLTFGWLHSSRCRTPVACNQSKKVIFHIYWAPLPKCVPFKVWSSAWEVDLCSFCIVDGKASLERGRQEIWRNLPTYFGLPSWNELIASSD